MINKQHLIAILGALVIVGAVVWIMMAPPAKAPLEVGNEFSQEGILIKYVASGKSDVWRLTYGQAESRELDVAGMSISGVESGMQVKVQGTEKDGKVSVSNIEIVSAHKDDLIWVSSPLPNQKEIASPITVTGFARGNWYFEASFPVKVLDGNGNLLAQEPAQAQGEWMVTTYVPFSITLNFAQPTTVDGTLVLEKDNPSGLPEFDNELRIPIKFKAGN